MPFKTLSIYHAEPPLLGSSFGHITHDKDMNKPSTPSSQPATDLPSWTPLRTLEDEGSSVASDLEVDELATRESRDLATKRLVGPPINARATVENIGTTAGRTSTRSSPGHGKFSKRKKARFDGVLIAKLPPHRKKFAGDQTWTEATPTTSARAFSLVDALARTFNANKHTENHAVLQSLPTSRQNDDASTGPQTDVETTEAEDEQLQSNKPFPGTLLRRRLGRARIIAASASASDTHSEDVPERPVKRLRQIQYEANSAAIDTALGTVQAPISWDAEMDFITRDDDFVTPVDVRMTADGDDVVAGKGPAPSSAWTPVGTGGRMPTSVGTKRAVLSPYQSRGAKFRQRLEAIFGESATVRTDRAARPRPVDLDFFAPLDELDRELSPSVSESTGSARSASTVEEVASAVPSTHITSQSPDNLPNDTELDQLQSGADSLTKTMEFGANEEQIIGWISALQRLVKGKVRIKEEDLETLSIVLAEIESVKANLDANVSMVSKLRESVKQLSELHEIPFGDRNRLRQRAANIFHTWSSARKLGAS